MIALVRKAANWLSLGGSGEGGGCGTVKKREGGAVDLGGLLWCVVRRRRLEDVVEGGGGGGGISVASSSSEGAGRLGGIGCCC